jgi:hypothetical protein
MNISKHHEIDFESLCQLNDLVERIELTLLLLRESASDKLSDIALAQCLKDVAKIQSITMDVEGAHDESHYKQTLYELNCLSTSETEKIERI